jgi:hypothetical protein
MEKTYTITLTAEELELIKISILSRAMEVHKSNTEEYESLCKLGDRVIKMQNA